MKRDKLGYIHLNGDSFNKYLRIAMKYYKTGDTDYLDSLFLAEKECFGENTTTCDRVIKAYICYDKRYTMASLPRILSLASFCGYKVDY